MVRGVFMRTLILFRHAKSSWADSSLDDFDRPLNGRGRKTAPMMASWLREEGLVPDLALVSAARRTIETWQAMARILEAPVVHRIEPDLYLASPDRILTVIGSVDDAVRTLLVLGHNPGTEDLAGLLAAADGGKANRRMREKFPTASAAVIDFAEGGWSGVRAGAGRLRAFQRPRDLD
jgi:phosphohistidine phosphatase